MPQSRAVTLPVHAICGDMSSAAVNACAAASGKADFSKIDQTSDSCVLILSFMSPIHTQVLCRPLLYCGS